MDDERPELRALVARWSGETVDLRVIWKKDYPFEWEPYGWHCIATDPADETALVRWYRGSQEDES